MQKNSLKIRIGDDNTVIVVIPASEIKNMNPDDTIMVNRIRINSKIMEYQKSGVTDSDIETILVKAMDGIRKQESQQRKTPIGAKMTIKDVLKLFTEPEKMHKNSFFLLEKG